MTLYDPELLLSSHSDIGDLTGSGSDSIGDLTLSSAPLTILQLSEHGLLTVVVKGTLGDFNLKLLFVENCSVGDATAVVMLAVSEDENSRSSGRLNDVLFSWIIFLLANFTEKDRKYNEQNGFNESFVSFCNGNFFLQILPEFDLPRTGC